MTVTITVIVTVVAKSTSDNTVQHGAIVVTTVTIAAVRLDGVNNETARQMTLTASNRKRRETVELGNGRICRNFDTNFREYFLATTALSAEILSNTTTSGRSSRSMKSESKKLQLRLEKLTHGSAPSRHWAYLQLTTLSTK